MKADATIHSERVDQREADRAFIRSLHATYPERVNIAAVIPAQQLRRKSSPKKQWNRTKWLAILRARQEAARISEFAKNRPFGEAVVAAVADWFYITEADIKSPSRAQMKVSARHTAIYILRQQKWPDGRHKFSMPEIAVLVGRQCHTTICHAVKTFHDRARKYPEMLAAVEAIDG